METRHTFLHTTLLVLSQKNLKFQEIIQIKTLIIEECLNFNIAGWACTESSCAWWNNGTMFDGILYYFTQTFVFLGTAIRGWTFQKVKQQT